jgi:two-component system, NtrC family, sensor kinase
MRRWMSTVRVRLAMGFIAVIVVVNAAVSLVTVLHVSRVLLDEVRTQVRTSLSSAQGIYDGYTKSIAQILRAVSVAPGVAVALKHREGNTLALPLQAMRREADLDILSLIGPDGRVICRARDQRRSGDDLSSISVIAQALKTRRPASGTVILPREIVERESKELAQRGLSSGMAIAVAVPVLDTDGQLLGLIFGATLLNQRYEIVDRIKAEAWREQTARSKSMGTRATIFQGDIRISTSVETDQGTRAIGTRMSAEVRDRVLNRGLTWSNRAVVVDLWYLTAYRPIRDPQGRIIGSLAVGFLEAPFVQPQRKIVAMFLSSMALITVASLLLLFLVARSVLRPIGGVIDMSRRVIGGDLSARLERMPPGEMGLLGQAINQMADAVDRRERQLKLVTQQQIGQSEKLASIGRLAAGIAHEVNNPLTGVLTFAHLLRKKPNLDDQDRQDLDLILRETTRVREIVKGLLDFARESPSSKQPLDINEVIRQAMALLRGQKEFYRIVIEEALEDDLPQISGDRNQLQQVLLNLSLNACEAMPDGGKLQITTSAQDGEVIITVSDTGCGIKEEHLERVFDPFFTTKPVGKGTGLGLSVSYGIIHQHEGTIVVESIEGTGSTFTVRLPALGDMPRAAEPKEADA